METVIASALEIKYSSGSLMRADDFGFCKTYINEKGIIRTTFERNMKYSDEFDFDSENALPVSFTYEYKLKNNIVATIFDDFDLLRLKFSDSDMPACDGDNW